MRFTLKPKLNLLLKIGAALKGKTPPDSHLWIVTDEVPAFVRFEGPMYSGPVWRGDLTSPPWAAGKGCPGSDSNRDALRHCPLKTAGLPVSPPGPAKKRREGPPALSSGTP